MSETEILRILFPPDGAIPLARIDSIPEIRKHIAPILALAEGRHVRSACDSHEVRSPFLRSDDGGLTFKRDRTPQEAEPAQIETEEVPTVRKSLIVEGGEQPKQEKKPSAPLDPETLAEIDRRLGEGVSVMDITAEFDKKGKLVPWTKIRARAAFLGRMKKAGGGDQSTESDKKVASTEDKHEDRPEPVSISRRELDNMMWDLHRSGKTPDEISEILCAEGIYYSTATVRRRLLQQGATF